MEGGVSLSSSKNGLPVRQACRDYPLPGLHIESDLHFSLLLVSSPALSFLLPFLFNPRSGLLPVIINFWEEK